MTKIVITIITQRLRGALGDAGDEASTINIKIVV
jgi:hypothetical protein